jgi:hypothetical protein
MVPVIRAAGAGQLWGIEGLSCQGHCSDTEQHNSVRMRTGVLSLRRKPKAILTGRYDLPGKKLQLNDQILAVLFHLQGLGNIGAFDQLIACGDVDIELPGAHGFWITPALAGLDIELPAMPGATDELAFARDPVLVGAVRQGYAGNQSAAQRTTLMRAAVGQSEKLTLDIEHRDLAIGYCNSQPFANGDISCFRHDMSGCLSS